VYSTLGEEEPRFKGGTTEQRGGTWAMIPNSKGQTWPADGQSMGKESAADERRNYSLKALGRIGGRFRKAAKEKKKRNGGGS